MGNNHFMTGPGTPGLVSVIIPCYNRGDIVGETIDSVLAQSYESFEIILVDDGSTDNTRDVIRSYDDRRLRYCYKANGGLSAARNSGLELARGEFIAFLDSDDVWHPWKLSAQMEILRKHPEVGLVWSDMSTFAAANEIIDERHLRQYYSAYGVIDLERRYLPSGTLADLGSDVPATLAQCPYYVFDVFHEMFSGNLVHPSTAVVRRTRLRQSGPFEPEITGRGGEDYHFYFRICSHGPVALLDAPTTLYRIHDSQLSTCNRLHEARGNLNVVRHWLEKRPSTLSPSIARRTLAASHAWLGAEELNTGDWRAAAHHLWQSLRHDARQPSTALLLVVSFVPRRAADALRVARRVLLRRAITRPLAGIVLILIEDADFITDVLACVQAGLSCTA